MNRYKVHTEYTHTKLAEVEADGFELEAAASGTSKDVMFFDDGTDEPKHYFRSVFGVEYLGAVPEPCPAEEHVHAGNAHWMRAKSATVHFTKDELDEIERCGGRVGTTLRMEDIVPNASERLTRVATYRIAAPAVVLDGDWFVAFHLKFATVERPEPMTRELAIAIAKALAVSDSGSRLADVTVEYGVQR